MAAEHRSSMSESPSMSELPSLPSTVDEEWTAAMLGYKQKMCTCYIHRFKQCDKAHKECLGELEDLNDDFKAWARVNTDAILM